MSYEISVSFTALCSCCGKELPSGSYLTESKPGNGPFDRDNPYERKDRRVFIRPCPDCFEWKGPPAADGEAEYASWLPVSPRGVAVAPDNRISVDRGALQMALNVLCRAGKNEVADALAESADAGVALPHQLKENHDASSTAQAPDVGVDVAGPVRTGSVPGQESAQAAGAEGTEPCGHMRRGVRKAHCRQCMSAAYPGVPFEEAARRFADESGVPPSDGGQQA